MQVDGVCCAKGYNRLAVVVCRGSGEKWTRLVCESDCIIRGKKRAGVRTDKIRHENLRACFNSYFDIGAGLIISKGIS